VSDKRGQNALESGQLNSAKGIPGPGRQKMTEQAKVLKRAERKVTAEFVAEIEKLSGDMIKVYKAGLKIALKGRKAMTADLREITLEPGPQEISVALRAADSIADRLHGKVRQQIEHSGSVNLIFDAEDKEA